MPHVPESEPSHGNSRGRANVERRPAPLMARPFTDEDAEWIRSHCAEIEGEFSLFFEARAAVFPKWRLLMDRLRGARDTVLTRGWPHRSEIEEGHNEICVAAAILEKPNSLVRSLDYEPKLGGTEKTIDFIAVVQGKAPCFVDVKTIAPKSVDRWEQYQWAHDARLLGDPPMLGLSREGLGGEIWHANVAARARMLEHTVELEDKLSLAGLLVKDTS